MKPARFRRSRISVALAWLRPPLLLVLLAAGVPALAQDPPHQEALDRGEELLAEEDWAGAVKAFKEADRAAGQSCADCLAGLAQAYVKLGAFKDALAAVDRALALPADEILTAKLHNQRGLALAYAADGDPKKLEQAAASFRKVLELSEGRANAARFSLGEMLLRLERDAEGIAVLEEYLVQEPQGRNAERARALIANPVRARKKLLPELEMVTLTGDFLDAEKLQGKVVLLDFWASWCTPCRLAVSELARLASRQREAPFLLIGISEDRDETALRDFLLKHKVSWPQVWDRDGRIGHGELDVDGFPTYILAGHDGEILYRASGWSEQMASELHRKVGAAVRTAKKAQAETAANSANSAGADRERSEAVDQ